MLEDFLQTILSYKIKMQKHSYIMSLFMKQ